MLLPSSAGKRLRTENYQRVSSQAIRSIDFAARPRTLEVEFIDGEIYHYYKVPHYIWTRMQAIIDTGGSLGTYVNQDLKAEVKRLNLDYGKIN